MATSARSYSSSYEDLNDSGKKRYREKLDLIGTGVVDPYVTRSRVSHSDDYFPLVEWPDVYNYLINAPSPITRQALKAYKSLDAYKYMVSGWVGDLCAFPATEDGLRVFVTCSVRHSQSVSAPPLKPWVAAEKSGDVVCAHCTCMAGLGEACSHIAALLLTLDARTRFVEDTSCTSEPCKWMPPSMRDVTYKEIHAIDFTSPTLKRKRTSASSELPRQVQKQKSPIENPLPSPTDLHSFYTALSAATKPVALSLVPGFSDQYVPKQREGFPPVLQDLYDETLLGADRDKIVAKSEQIFQSISVSELEAKNVEEATRGQHQSSDWYRYRAGRITASRFRAAAVASVDSPPRSLIMSLCYPESYKFKSPATSWGIRHEDVAREEYTRKHLPHHTQFRVTTCGLVLNSDWPHLGASPDGYICCECCGLGVLEIKCPYSLREKSIEVSAKQSDFCLQRKEGSYHLRRGHAYFYQTQAQMHICQAKYCDFVVWSQSEVVTLRVEPDKPFIDEVLKSITAFHQLCVMPELISKHYSNRFGVDSSVSAQSPSEPSPRALATSADTSDVCICKTGKVDELVTCSNMQCSVKKFHLSCTRLKKVPVRRWYCSACRKGRNQQTQAKKCTDQTLSMPRPTYQSLKAQKGTDTRSSLDAQQLQPASQPVLGRAQQLQHLQQHVVDKSPQLPVPQAQQQPLQPVRSFGQHLATGTLSHSPPDFQLSKSRQRCNVPEVNVEICWFCLDGEPPRLRQCRNCHRSYHHMCQSKDESGRLCDDCALEFQ